MDDRYLFGKIISRFVLVKGCLIHFWAEPLFNTLASD